MEVGGHLHHKEVRGVDDGAPHLVPGWTREPVSIGSHLLPAISTVSSRPPTRPISTTGSRTVSVATIKEAPAPEGIEEPQEQHQPHL